MNICRIKENVLFSVKEKHLNKKNYIMETTDGISYESFKEKAGKVLSENGMVFYLTDRNKEKILSYLVVERTVHSVDEFEKIPEVEEDNSDGKKSSRKEKKPVSIYSIFEDENKKKESAKKTESAADQENAEGKNGFFSRLGESIYRIFNTDININKKKKDDAQKEEPLKEGQFYTLELTEFVQLTDYQDSKEKILKKLEEQVVGYVRSFNTDSEVKGIIFNDSVYLRKNVFNSAIPAVYTLIGIGIGFMMGSVLNNVGLGLLWFIVFTNLGWGFSNTGKEYKFKKRTDAVSAVEQKDDE